MGDAKHPPFFTMQLSLRLLLLVAGILFCLVGHWLPLQEKSQLFLMVITFILLGIPHGALDVYIEGGLEQQQNHQKIFLRYVLTAVLYIGLWYWQPSIALVVFILVTAFHFGEIDWIGNTGDQAKKLIYFVLGLCWILLLLSKHIDTALGVFESITRNQINKQAFIYWGQLIYPLSVIGLLLTYGFLYYHRQKYFSWPQYWYLSALQQLVLLILAHTTPLWIFFAFYFGIWHSVLSLDKIRAHFKLNATWNNWVFLLKKAMPFSAMAWIGILYFIFLTVKSNDPTGMLSLVFIGLAVLTIPHLQVFTKLNK
jgi:Brp/Blh family beta-carotene 15,15'-monooxygenase